MKSETRMFRLWASVTASLGYIGGRETSPAILRRYPEADFNQAAGGSRRRVGNCRDDLVGDIGFEVAPGMQSVAIAGSEDRIYMPRRALAAALGGHLTFALKHEGLDLRVLKALFQAAGPRALEAMVTEPQSLEIRR